MGIIEAKAQRRILRNEALKANKARRVGQVASSSIIPSLMSFKGMTGSGIPLLTFLSPCQGFISNITFRGEDLESSNVIIKISRPNGAIYMNQYKVSQLSELDDDSLSVSVNDLIDVNVESEGDQEVFVSFLFNIIK